MISVDKINEYLIEFRSLSNRNFLYKIDVAKYIHNWYSSDFEKYLMYSSKKVIERHVQCSFITKAIIMSDPIIDDKNSVILSELSLYTNLAFLLSSGLNLDINRPEYQNIFNSYLWNVRHRKSFLTKHFWFLIIAMHNGNK